MKYKLTIEAELDNDPDRPNIERAAISSFGNVLTRIAIKRSVLGISEDAELTTLQVLDAILSGTWILEPKVEDGRKPSRPHAFE